MNSREKLLLVVVLGVGGLFLLRMVSRGYQGKLAALDNEIGAKQKVLDKAEKAKSDAVIAQAAWRRTGGQTLSMDENEAKNLLRREMFALATQAGLQEATVDLGQVKRWLRGDVRRLPGTVKARGTLPQIVGFLFQLHRQPYEVRVTQLTIDKEVRTVRQGQARVIAEDTDVLDLTVRLETLLLPVTKLVPRVTPVKLEGKERGAEKERTALASAAQYQAVIRPEVFKFYVPPVPPGKAMPQNPQPNATVWIPSGSEETTTTVSLQFRPGTDAARHEVFFGEGSPGNIQPLQGEGTSFVQTVELSKTYWWRVDAFSKDDLKTTGDMWRFVVQRQQAGGIVEVPPPVVQAPQPAADQNMVLSRVYSSPRGQIAVLQDPANPQGEDKRVEVGEGFYGGTLVFVHQKGAVSERDGLRQFHVIGEPLRNAKPLTQVDHPQIWSEIAKLERLALGRNGGAE